LRWRQNFQLAVSGCRFDCFRTGDASSSASDTEYGRLICENVPEERIPGVLARAEYLDTRYLFGRFRLTQGIMVDKELLSRKIYRSGNTLNGKDFCLTLAQITYDA
jgi:uncharacterized membrane-anchored protein